jgi:WD40 repeat protein
LPGLANPTGTPEAPSLLTPSPEVLPPAIAVAGVGIALPEASPAINRENYSQLRNLARWGYGSIRAVAATPDGSHLIVASEEGIARYDLNSPQTPPEWFPFSQPVNAWDATVSSDGRYVSLLYWTVGADYSRVFFRYTYDLDNQQFVPEAPGVIWVRAMEEPATSYSIEVSSPNGERIFKGRATNVMVNGEYTSAETAVAEMYDALSGTLLYSLNDPVQYVYYRDRAMPVACDLYVFSMCGNALMRVAMSAFQAEFSTTGETFAVLYRSPSLGNPSEFSTVRIYRLADGQLIGQVGGFSDPVADFTYLPGQEQLLIGFVNGAIQLYDIPSEKVLFSARHFQLPIWYLTYSYSGKILVIQRPYEVEVRLARDGSLFGRYAATASAVSPVENLLAYGSADGTLIILDLDTLQVVQQIAAHTALIYSVRFSPDGGQIISSGQDCSVRLWDAHSGVLIHPFEEVTVNPIGEPNTASRIFLFNLNFVPQRNQVIGYGSWGTVVSWNTNSGAAQFVTSPAPSYYADGTITIHPQFPEWFAVKTESELFYLDQNSYSLQTGELVGEYQAPEGLPEDCLGAGPLSADGSLRFTIGYGPRNGQVCVLDASNFSLLSTLQIIPPPADQFFFLSWVYLSPDGKQLIASASTGAIYVYQVAP